MNMQAAIKCLYFSLQEVLEMIRKNKVEKTKYYIEAKASQGNEEIFELGSSEIRKAIETADNDKCENKISEGKITYNIFRTFQIDKTLFKDQRQ